MYVKRSDGCCQECGGVLEIVDANDCSMDVVCTQCGEDYTVETDAFGDGSCVYWPMFMAELDEVDSCW